MKYICSILFDTKSLKPRSYAYTWIRAKRDSIVHWIIESQLNILLIFSSRSALVFIFEGSLGFNFSASLSLIFSHTWYSSG